MLLSHHRHQGVLTSIALQIIDSFLPAPLFGLMGMLAAGGADEAVGGGAVAVEQCC